MSGLRRFTKRGQTGQSLVILAIGFLALLGFVGIVTDVSVLFIRYSTMRRAIDAAAIAAAGQMRRVADEDGDLLAQGEATSVANLNLAARQFIEVYGLNPKNVIVETCRAQQVARDINGNALDTAGVRLFDDAGNTVSTDAELIARYQELCTDDELKLVRVTAQIDAPTIFLRLLGYPTVTLTESAISQTAVIDVVLVMDVSESMLNQTGYDDWDTLTPPQGVRYIPPFVNYSKTEPGGAWEFLVTNDEDTLDVLTGISGVAPSIPDARIGDIVQRYELDGSGNVIAYDSSTSTRTEPRDFCRARAFPASSNRQVIVPLALRQEYYDFLNVAYPPPDTDPLTYSPIYAIPIGADAAEDDLIATYNLSPKVSHPGSNNNPAAAGNAFYHGFVPMYDFYGCCNDPDGVLDAAGNFGFEDLVCQPFGEARDAANDFLSRLDFLRGDRVGFVTFANQATLIDPDGEEASGGGPQSYMIETENNLYDSGGTLLRRGASEVLNSVVGVMAEDSFYVDSNNDGMWDRLVDEGSGTGHRTYDEFGTVRIGEILNNPVRRACIYDTAKLNVQEYLLPSDSLMPDGVTPRPGSLLTSVITVPDWYMTNGINTASGFSVAPGTSSLNRSYEFAASCGRSNIGGGLAGGSLMLYEGGRREGAVWIMVMLSDGAAGASNPIATIQGTNIGGVRPYFRNGSGVYDPQVGTGGPIGNTTLGTGGYGFFGLCPYGTEQSFTDATDIRTQPQLLVSNNFPNCSDLLPETRHFCGTYAAPADDSLDQDNFASTTRCIDFYDVDDYAKDYANWIGVADLPNAVGGTSFGRVSDQLLPTIFTIGYGFNYDTDTFGSDGNPINCAGNLDCVRGDPAAPPASGNDTNLLRRDRNADYLGEELLRYIADVGDNFQIDSDYWQLCQSETELAPPPQITNASPCLRSGFTNADHRIGNYIELRSLAPMWGVRGPCEETTWTGSPDPYLRGENFEPVAPKASCGNYFVASSGNQLQEVFDQIASRMFTRLSQ